MQKISIGRNKKAKRLKEKKKLLMVFQRTPKITSKDVVFFLDLEITYFGPDHLCSSDTLLKSIIVPMKDLPRHVTFNTRTPETKKKN